MAWEVLDGEGNLHFCPTGILKSLNVYSLICRSYFAVVNPFSMKVGVYWGRLTFAKNSGRLWGVVLDGLVSALFIILTTWNIFFLLPCRCHNFGCFLTTSYLYLLSLRVCFSNRKECLDICSFSFMSLWWFFWLWSCSLSFCSFCPCQIVLQSSSPPGPSTPGRTSAASSWRLLSW